MILVAVVAVWAGCINGDASLTTVADVPAAQLIIEPSVIDADPAPSDGKLPVVVQFFHDNAFVQLAGNAGVMCNGMPMPWSGLGYAIRIPLPAAGDTLVFSHVRAGTTTMTMLRVPPRPVISLPTQGTTIKRTTNLAIVYSSTMSAGVRPDASDDTIGVIGSEQSDNGTAYLDVSGLHVGNGAISIERRYVFLQAGTGFQGVDSTYTISSPDTAVIWQ